MCRNKDGAPNFEKELEEIQKEKQRIQRQRRKPNWSSYWINNKGETIDKIALEHKHATLDFVPKRQQYQESQAKAGKGEGNYLEVNSTQ